MRYLIERTVGQWQREEIEAQTETVKVSKVFYSTILPKCDHICCQSAEYGNQS